jgi:hypothetical protein
MHRNVNTPMDIIAILFFMDIRKSPIGMKKSGYTSTMGRWLSESEYHQHSQDETTQITIKINGPKT